MARSSNAHQLRSVMLSASLLLCPIRPAASGAERAHAVEPRDTANATSEPHLSTYSTVFDVEHPGSDFVFDSCDGSVVRTATIVFRLASASKSAGEICALTSTLFFRPFALRFPSPPHLWCNR